MTEPRFDYAANVGVLVVELKQIRDALSAIDAAVTGLDCNDFAAQRGIASWTNEMGLKLHNIIKDMEGEEQESDQ